MYRQTGFPSLHLEHITPYFQGILYLNFIDILNAGG